MSTCLPTTNNNNTTNKKVYAASITDSIKSNNSTSPLPKKQHVKNNDQVTQQQHQKVSRDVATLYELFSSVSTLPSYNQYSNPLFDTPSQHVVCFCCEREIIKKQHSRNISISTLDFQQQIEEEEELRKRKIEEITSNITSALYYGSFQVRKYMKKVMRRDNWEHILKHGFPCPHQQQQEKQHYFCTLCDQHHQHTTLRLTLTPSSCRAQDNEIYGEYQYLQTLHNNKKKFRKQGKKFLV